MTQIDSGTPQYSQDVIDARAKAMAKASGMQWKGLLLTSFQLVCTLIELTATFAFRSEILNDLYHLLLPLLSFDLQQHSTIE